jgi:hypothetical protein
MDEAELIRMAMFKLSDTARRLDTLAHAAKTLRGRHLLTTVASVLASHEQALRATLDDAAS